jgi:hypothetical protein
MFQIPEGGLAGCFRGYTLEELSTNLCQHRVAVENNQRDCQDYINTHHQFFL